MHAQAALFRIEITDEAQNFTVEMTRNGSDYRVVTEARQRAGTLRRALSAAGFSTKPLPAQSGAELLAAFSIAGATLTDAFEQVMEAFSEPLRLMFAEWEFTLGGAATPQLLFVMIDMVDGDKIVLQIYDHEAQPTPLTAGQWQAYAGELDSGSSNESHLLQEAGLEVISVKPDHIDVSIPLEADLTLLEVIAKCCP